MAGNGSLMIFDGHNDTLLSIYQPREGEARSFFAQSAHGHIDYPRALEGGFGGGFFAVFTPNERRDPNRGLPSSESFELPLPEPLDYTYALRHTMAMSGLLFRLEAESAGKLRVVRRAADLAECLEKGTMAAILHFEGAETIDTDLNALEVFYRAGLRSLGLVWSRANAFATGVPFAFPRSPDIGPGLTDAGKELVRACNRLGIMIDLSHLNEAGFWDVAKLSDAPLVATHSNVHTLCASSRNLTDKQLDAIRESDGMVGLNFAVGFLRADGRNETDTPIEVMLRHIEYLVERIGIERVGFGSDFDGARIPAPIGDVRGLPRLMDALRERGYDDAALRKLAHENWLRVLKQTWA
jgi:membrane dipeptidase